MRIAIDVRHLGRGGQSGVGQYTLELLRALAPMINNELELVSTGLPKAKRSVETYLGDLSKLQRITHSHSDTPNKVLNLRTLFTKTPTLESLCKNEPDLLFLPNINFLSTKKPYVVTFHDLSFEIFPETFSSKWKLWHRLINPKRIARDAQAIIVPSKSTKDDLIALYNIVPEKIFVIPHGVNPDFQARATPQDHGVRSRLDLPKHFLLHIGNQEPRKNIPMVVSAYLDAFKNCDALRQNDVHLVLAGAPRDALSKIKLRLTTADNEAMRRIHFLGYVLDQDRPALYRAADTLLFPSLYEGFGLPILEAFASGTPVITSHTSAMLEVGASAAILINPYDEQDLSRAICILSSDNKLRERLIEAGFERAESYKWQKTAQKTLEVLRSIEL